MAGTGVLPLETVALVNAEVEATSAAGDDCVQRWGLWGEVHR